MHTNMSTMDALTKAEDLIARAVKWGHPAVAITDHGVLQSFPAAFRAAKGKIRLIPGCEGYLIEEKAVVDNPAGNPYDGPIVVLDFYGEDDTKGESKDDPRAFAKQNVWKRMFVILMGPLMNFVLAFCVAVVFFWCAGNMVPTGEVDPFISQVMASGPAQRAGMKDGDIITEINGANMLDGTAETLLNTISGWKDGDEPLQANVKRGEETLELSLTPEWNEDAEKYQIGVYRV